MLLFTCFVRENIAFNMHYYVGMSKLNTTFCVCTSFGITFIVPSIVLLSLCSIKWSMQCVIVQIPRFRCELGTYFGIVCHRVQNQNKQTRRGNRVIMGAWWDFSIPFMPTYLLWVILCHIQYILQDMDFLPIFSGDCSKLSFFYFAFFSTLSTDQGSRPSTRSWPTYVFRLPIQL
jgi:hypothetical protein